MRYIATDYNFSVTRTVKSLIIANALIWFFLIVIFQRHFAEDPIVFKAFGLSPVHILKYRFWQFFTYMFLHSSGVFHLLFNMFVLWMFGSELEKHWGPRLFLSYYLFSGVGAGLIYCACCFIYIFVFQGSHPEILVTPVIGASGAVFGLLLAYGLIYSERIIYFMMIFPIKARHFTMIIAAIELVTILDNGFGGPVANLAHLGGLISGFLFIKSRKWFQRSYFKRLRKRMGSVHLKVLENDDKSNSYRH